DQLSQPIPAVKYAYLRAAEELGDPFATQIIINASTYIGELSDEDKSAGDALSKSILERIAQ
ncbi:MAG: hypothetical protein K8963_02990, partial [Proteobacteria bacterium]|nr:hypothetical protein [Pseudomonadota bacterium]